MARTFSFEEALLPQKEKTFSFEEAFAVEPEQKPESGFVPAFKAGVSGVQEAAAALAGRTGLIDEETARKYIEEQQRYQAQTFRPTEEGWTEDPLTKIKELVGGSIPYIGAPIAGALAANPLYTDCVKAAQSKFQEAEYVKKDEPPQQDCPCLDKDGKAIPGVFAKKDKDGNCLKETCESSCECKKADGTTYTVEKNPDGSCKDCEEEGGGGEDMDLKTQPREAEWWLQDTVNAAGAFGDLMGIRKRISIKC